MENLPDGLSALANYFTEGYATNGIARKDYEIPDIILHAPITRKLKVISIGAGRPPLR